MVRYRHTGSELMYTAQTTGGNVISIANNGVTRIASTAAERYVMAAPVAGCMKTLLFSVSTSSLDRVIELSSASSGDTVTILTGTGTAVGTEITVQGTQAYGVTLIGLSSIQWQFTQGWVMDVPSTAVQLGAS